MSALQPEPPSPAQLPVAGRPRLSRRTAFAIVLVLWAAICLPGLGVQEFQGEEPTRVLPALRMLQKGDWILPHIGGEPYNKKPPLINWLVAASVAVTGSEAEWAARLPSAVLMLAFLAAVIWLPAPWMDPRARLIVAVVFLTNLVLIEKARSIEIDGTYACLTGLAMLSWLVAWTRRSSRWLLWLLPYAFLLLGMLEKGPLHLLPFAVLVLVVAIRTGRARELLCWQHAVGVALLMGPSLAWYLVATQRGAAAGTDVEGELWTQLFNRFIPKDIPAWGYNGVKSLGHFLPWLLCAPLLWSRRVLERLGEVDRRRFRALRLAAVLGWLSLAVLPGFRARYALPAFPLLALAVGWAVALYRPPERLDRVWRWALVLGHLLAAAAAVALLTGLPQRGLAKASVGRVAPYANPVAWLAAAVCVAMAAVVFRRRQRYQGTLALTLTTAGLAVAAIAQYAAFGPALLAGREHLRPLAAAVRRHVDEADATIYLYRPQREGFVYYIRRPWEYVVEPAGLGPHVRYLIVHEGALAELRQGGGPLAGRQVTELYAFKPKAGEGFRLVRLGRGAPSDGKITDDREDGG